MKTNFQRKHTLFSVNLVFFKVKRYVHSSLSNHTSKKIDGDRDRETEQKKDRYRSTEKVNDRDVESDRGAMYDTRYLV